MAQIKASHILIGSIELANEIKAKLDDGYDFEALAEQYSKCPSKKKGGNLGWFGRGMMVREFEKAAFSLKVGQISEPIKTQFGWHIIKLTDEK